MILWLSLACFLVYIVYCTVTYVRHRLRLTKPIRYVPGPKPLNFLYGNIKDIRNAKPDPMALLSNWVQQYGSVMKYRMLLGTRVLLITDLKALNHILSNSFDYEKPEPSRWLLGRVTGHGLINAEGEMHKQQRRIMNPAFGAAQIRELTDIFINKSMQLRDRWQALADARPGENVRIDALSWLSRATLDIIGLAGFNYAFDALNPTGKLNELNEAFSTVFRASEKGEVIDFIQARFAPFRRLPPLSTHQAAIARARQIMQRVGLQLLNESKTALLGTGEKGDNWRARDLLSLLIRANMGSDLDDSQRMTDFDVLSQIATFLVAGHETTSTATTWTLHILSNDIRVQTKLREELLAVPTDSPSMDELNALPYLDQVVREVLRLQPPVAASMRTAIKDSVIPLDKPWTDTKGSVHDTVRVAKGQLISIPIQVLNKAKWLWGEDADEFKPERWSTVPPAAAAIPGVWSHILTFLAGNRSCIGVKFAVIEMKALLFTIIRAFEFEPVVPAEDVGKRMSVVTRPFLVSEPHDGNQLPVYIKPVRADLS